VAQWDTRGTVGFRVTRSCEKQPPPPPGRPASAAARPATYVGQDAGRLISPADGSFSAGPPSTTAWTSTSTASRPATSGRSPPPRRWARRSRRWAGDELLCVTPPMRSSAWDVVAHEVVENAAFRPAGFGRRRHPRPLHQRRPGPRAAAAMPV